MAQMKEQEIRIILRYVEAQLGNIRESLPYGNENYKKIYIQNKLIELENQVSDLIVYMK